MKRTPKTLPAHPPRPYGLRDAYDRRVWRSVWAQLARDALLVALSTIACGFLYAHDAVFFIGVAGAGLALVGGLLAGLRANLLRARLLRSAPQATATLGRTKRVLFLHEFFRGDQERSFLLSYRFALPEGGTQRGQILVCGCVRDRLTEGSTEAVVYDPDRPRRSVPLRLAVMVAPHR